MSTSNLMRGVMLMKNEILVRTQKLEEVRLFQRYFMFKDVWLILLDQRCQPIQCRLRCIDQFVANRLFDAKENPSQRMVFGIQGNTMSTSSLCPGLNDQIGTNHCLI